MSALLDMERTWARLRFSPTTAIRAALVRAVSEGHYAPATANKHLAALRGVLKAAWRLGVMETEEHLRAVDLRPSPAADYPPFPAAHDDVLAATTWIMANAAALGGDPARVAIAGFG